MIESLTITYAHVEGEVACAVQADIRGVIDSAVEGEGQGVVFHVDDGRAVGVAGLCRDHTQLVRHFAEDDQPGPALDKVGHEALQLRDGHTDQEEDEGDNVDGRYLGTES
jgi:hypothetical protein